MKLPAHPSLTAYVDREDGRVRAKIDHTLHEIEQFARDWRTYLADATLAGNSARLALLNNDLQAACAELRQMRSLQRLLRETE